MCESTTNNCRERTDKNTSTSGAFLVGQTVMVNTNDRCSTAPDILQSEYANGSKIFSIRVYDKSLTPGQLAANYEVDRRRFTAPPTVRIGDQYCTDVVVLSENFLMCKVPAGSLGTKNVEVVSDDVVSTYSDAYEYVDNNAFYIRSISPIVGKANQSGQILTLTGNKLEDIDTVVMDGDECTYNSDAAGAYKYNLPAKSAGETDIIITLKGGEVYRFAKVFEYQ
jgi:hypothetical protein